MTLMETAGENRLQCEKYHDQLQEAVRDVLWRFDPESGSAGDSALLAYFYLEAYVQTGQPCYRRAARAALDGLLADGTFRERTDWTGLLITALAKADRVLGSEKYLKAAQELKSGLTAGEGKLENSAFSCWALVELYETDFSVSHLREASELADRMADMFWDGGFCRAAGLALVKLARITGEERFRTLAERQLEWLDQDAEEDPAERCLALLAALETARPRQELVCAARERIPGWLAAVGETYRLAVLAKTSDNGGALADAAPWTAALPVPASGETLYLCRERSCMPPVNTVAALRELFREQRELVPQ